MSESFFYLIARFPVGWLLAPTNNSYYFSPSSKSNMQQNGIQYRLLFSSSDSIGFYHIIPQFSKYGHIINLIFFKSLIL